jgi:hypothetical protein
MALEVMTWRKQGADAPSAIKAWFLPVQTTGYSASKPRRSNAVACRRKRKTDGI